MSAFLTQKEIDTIFAGGVPASEAFPPETQVVPYDFVRPARVPKDRRAALDAVYARFAFMFQMMLSSRLRGQADVIVRGVELVTRAELAMSLRGPMAAFLFRASAATPALGLVDWGGEFALYALDRLFGGPGEAAADKRSLNTLEQGAVRLLTERALGSLTEAWQEHVALKPEITAFESDPEALGMAGLGEDLLLALLDVRSGEASGAVTLATPVAAIESFFKERGNERAPSSRTIRVEPRAMADSRLTGASLGITVRMPVQWLPTRALLGLEPGQVLETAHSLESLAEVHVNGRPCYLGTLGRFKQRVGVRITEAMKSSGPERPGRPHPGRVS